MGDQNIICGIRDYRVASGSDRKPLPLCLFTAATSSNRLLYNISPHLDEKVRNDPELMNKFLDAICKVDMELDENILSRHEYELALNGKRHLRDF